MPMLVHALAGSATYVMKRLRIKSALRTSLWLMTMSFSLMALTAANGCFAPPAKSHIISDVFLLKVNNTSKPEDGPLPVPSMNVRAPKVKWVNLTRSTYQVTKWVTYSELLISSYTMKKFSKKGKGGKIHVTPEEIKDTMSHKNKKNQQWKEELIEEAKILWEANKNKPPKEQLSMRAIAAKLNLPKTTVIERLTGRRKGEGHIAGGKRKARVLTDGKQAGQNNCNHNCFNQTFNRVSKQVIPSVACTGDPVSCKLVYFIPKPIFHPFFARPRR